MEKAMYRGQPICEAVMQILDTCGLKQHIKSLIYSGTVDEEAGRIYETVLIVYANGQEDEIIVTGLQPVAMAKKLLDYFDNEDNYMKHIYVGQWIPTSVNYYFKRKE